MKSRYGERRDAESCVFFFGEPVSGGGGGGGGGVVANKTKGYELIEGLNGSYELYRCLLLHI